jgi:uncharacterized membrane-anchored protein YjiN (DUF445 family)
VKDVLYWLIPPFLGGAIGFITNVLAIKMLFRPLGEARVFGIRLPFTPGILPRQRHRLAESIGGMVERELLVPDLIREHLKTPEVRDGVKKAAARYTRRFLSLPAGFFLDKAAAVGDAFFPFIGEFVSSPRWKELLGFAAEAVSQRAGTKRLLEKSLLEITGLNDGELFPEKALSGFISGRAERITGALVPWAEGAYPLLVKRCGEFLRRPPVRHELEEQGRIFLLRIMLKLNAFQRFFVSAGQYDKTIAERMPEIVDDLIVQLEETLNNDTVRRSILSLLESSLVKFFSDPDSSLYIARFLLKSIRAQLDRPLGELFGFFGGKDPRERIADIIKRLLSPDSGPGESPETFFLLIAEKVSGRFGGEELGAFLGVSETMKEKLDSFAAEKVLAIADSRIAGILKTLDVKAMISGRIDSLEMERVEGIILDVMARELKWIDVFGGVLGFLIGIFQALFTWLLRTL